MSAYRWSFSWDSIDFGGVNFNVHVSEPSWPGLPAPRNYRMKLAAASGSVSQGSTWDDLWIDMVCWIAAIDANARSVYVDNVETALMTTVEGEKPLVLGWRPNMEYSARLDSPFAGMLAITGMHFPLRFWVPSGTGTRLW